MRPFQDSRNYRLGTIIYFGCGTWADLDLRAHAKTSQTNIEKALGAALLIGAAAMIVRSLLDRRGGQERQGVVHGLIVRPFPTVLIGMVGGLIVGMTSVGSGSLMIVLLLFLYPMIGANQLVGTDLTQAVPLTVAAALGALAFGHVEFAVTTSIIIGSVPGVLVGSFLSSRAPDKYIRPGNHLRHLRFGAQVRRSRHHRPGRARQLAGGRAVAKAGRPVGRPPLGAEPCGRSAAGIDLAIGPQVPSRPHPSSVTSSGQLVGIGDVGPGPTPVRGAAGHHGPDRRAVPLVGHRVGLDGDLALGVGVR